GLPRPPSRTHPGGRNGRSPTFDKKHGTGSLCPRESRLAGLGEVGASLWRRTTTRRWRGGFRTDKGLPVVLERGATRTQRSQPPADRDCVRQSSRRKGMCPNVPRVAYVGGRTDACWSPIACPRGRENGELWRAAEDAVQ